MTIAVTAVSGQLGCAIVRALERLDTAESIVGLARTPTHVHGLDIDLRPGDYAEPGQLSTSLRGVRTLLLVSGNEQPTDRIRQHRNVLGAARAAGVGKVVYTSAQGAEEGTAFSPVVQSNRQTEADVRTYRLHGEPLTQWQLVEYINRTFKTDRWDLRRHSQRSPRHPERLRGGRRTTASGMGRLLRRASPGRPLTSRRLSDSARC